MPLMSSIGYSGAECDVEKVMVVLESKNGSIKVCENGAVSVENFKIFVCAI